VNGNDPSAETHTAVPAPDSPGTATHHPAPGPPSAPTMSERGAEHSESQRTVSLPGSADTRSHSDEAPDASRPLPNIPEYEVEEEIARGGMGVVYRARHLRLNRPTAIKMILGGKYQDTTARVRFLIEAEAVAALDHPNVVRVYESGTHESLPFFAMEFVGGGTLANKLNRDGKPAPLAAADLLVKLAEAIASAHAKGVVHRDLKPSNVLLTEAGEPKVTDFGLAKFGQSEMTVTGAIMGTPSYMAPEQAAGRSRAVGTHSDVYALGAILYELLTGRPPFKGESASETIQHVLTREPDRPRAIDAAVPRDLETICLKCLEKQPPKRYPTAQSLADDLNRYLRNEPISARPAGALERAYKWAKRNKVVAGASATVALALAAGAGVSLGFGLEAQKQADLARKKEKDAEDAAAGEAKEKRDAVAARNELKAKNDELKRTLAKALLGPIAANSPLLSLTPYEVNAFWQIAELRRDEVASLFLDEATRTPLARKQLSCRAEYALHAVIGLDSAQRNAADQLFRSRLIAGGDASAELALSVSRGDFASPETVTVAARALTDALARETDPVVRSAWAEGLAAVAGRMEPSEVARALADALAKETTPYARWVLTGGLAALVGRMEPSEAAKVCAPVAHALTAALDKVTDPSDRGALARSIAAVAGRMEPSEAAKVCAPVAHTLTAALDKETDPSARRAWAGSLAALAGYMEPSEAAKMYTRTARALTDALDKVTDSNARPALAEDLAVITLCLPPDDRSRSQRATVLATGAFAAPYNVLPSLPLLHPHFQPRPRPLPPQELVDLLKHPFCVGEVRRTVLDALEYTYKRPFKDQWEFVEYAQKHQPQLDLLTPPKRPEQKP
jgi:tRNA A-37 threonylcarbamoyl transferase component Bud32